MDILDSAWLLRMLDKAGSPHERLLALFDILGDWLDAPLIRERLNAQDFKVPELADIESQPLLAYLTAQALASGAHAPETLARQLYFMCMSMLREELHSPGCAANDHAKQVARALIQAQTQKERFITKRSAYAMAASVFFITGILGVLAFGLFKPYTFKSYASAQNTILAPGSGKAVVTGAQSTEARPEQTAALFAVIEQMRRGECQFPEALLLPDAQKAVYLTNVIEGQISTNADDQKLVIQLLKKVRCNYTPMLMKNSVG
jgi:hypothetical protein